MYFSFQLIVIIRRLLYLVLLMVSVSHIPNVSRGKVAASFLVPSALGSSDVTVAGTLAIDSHRRVVTWTLTAAER